MNWRWNVIGFLEEALGLFVEHDPNTTTGNEGKQTKKY